MNVDVVRQVLEALEREHARYVVFGAVAMAVHGLPRATEDLDLFVAPDRDNIERVKRPPKVPVVLTPREIQSVLAQLNGDYRVMAELLYGSGLRLMGA